MGTACQEEGRASGKAEGCATFCGLELICGRRLIHERWEIESMNQRS